MALPFTALGAPASVPRVMGLGWLPIWQGATNSSTAQFSTIVPSAEPYFFKVIDTQKQEFPVNTWRREVSPLRDFAVLKISVQGLSIGSYLLQVFNSSGDKVDEREFSTLDLGKKSVRLALVSCANDRYASEQERNWQVVAERAPEMIFFIGDTVYADNESATIMDHDGGWNNFWRRYVEGFQSLSIYRFRKLIPIMATWDDHDFGVDDGDESFIDKPVTSFLFDLFWGFQSIEGYERGPGVASAVSFAGQRFFLMDNRTYRSAAGTTLPYHWGQPVQDFLLERLPLSKDPAWILSGAQIFGAYLGSDSFEGRQPQNLKDVLSKISGFEAPVLFGTGDVHYSEFMNLEASLLGYPSYEITSSAIHSHTFPGQHLRGRNRRRIKATSTSNFILIESQAVATGQILFNGECINSSNRGKFDVSGHLKK